MAKPDQQPLPFATAEELRCPVCGHVFDGEEYYHNVSYFGGGVNHQACDRCGSRLEITEAVVRTWSVDVLPFSPSPQAPTL